MGNFCFGESKAAQNHRRSTRVESRVVTSNIMQNMNNEYEENKIRKQASRLSTRQSRSSMHGGPGMGRRGSNLSVAGKRRDRMDRKSICIEANAELSRFSMMLDVDKSSDLKKLKENEEKRRSKLDIVNRRVSVSNPNLAQEAALGLSVPKNNGRRLSLVIPGQDESPGGGGFNAGRRVSIGGRRNSTVFNFDPRALPNTQDVNLQAQPKKSALRRPSFVETFVEDDTDDLI